MTRCARSNIQSSGNPYPRFFDMTIHIRKHIVIRRLGKDATQHRIIHQWCLLTFV